MSHSLLSYDMFDFQRSASEARRFDRLSNIYHRGQSLAWNGQDVLASLVEKHGGVKIPPHLLGPVQRVYAPILWGELAAWRIAAQLADRIEPLEAKMAATSQAHDEARHFYVMHDYLKLATGGVPKQVSPATEKLLGLVLDTKVLAKKLVGMQLQVETTALTIFQATREARFCPVLSDLLLYFEKDEARHVGLGTQYLPTLFKTMTIPERIDFTAFQFKVIFWSLASTRVLEPDLRALGLDPRRLLTLGKSKQDMVYNELFDLAPGSRSVVGEVISRGIEGAIEGIWPHETTVPTLTGRVGAILRTLREGAPMVETHIAPPS
jgi:hypothetical protein